MEPLIQSLIVLIALLTNQVQELQKQVAQQQESIQYHITIEHQAQEEVFLSSSTVSSTPFKLQPKGAPGIDKIPVSQ